MYSPNKLFNKILINKITINFQYIKNIDRFRDIYTLLYKNFIKFPELEQVVSYYLSKWTLKDIEQAIQKDPEYIDNIVRRTEIKEKLSTGLDTEASYIGNNCWPGFLTRIVFDKMQSNTPTMDVRINLEDFIKMSEQLEFYLNVEPVQDTLLSKNQGYIVMRLNDICIHHIHKSVGDWDKVLKLWKQRVQKIHWENKVLVLFIDEYEFERNKTEEIKNKVDTFLKIEKSDSKLVVLTNLQEVKNLYLNNSKVVFLQEKFSIDGCQDITDSLIAELK